jgi:hypothetical protein
MANTMLICCLGQQLFVNIHGTICKNIVFGHQHRGALFVRQVTVTSLPLQRQKDLYLFINTVTEKYKKCLCYIAAVTKA